MPVQVGLKVGRHLVEGSERAPDLGLLAGCIEFCGDQGPQQSLNRRDPCVETIDPVAVKAGEDLLELC